MMRDTIMGFLAGINRLGKVRPAPAFLGMGQSGRLSPQFFSQLLTRLRPGQVYELMCHPGAPANEETIDERIRAYHDWDLERRTLCDAQTQIDLATHNVRLIGYRHLQLTREGMRICPEEIRK
jgi:predicted glycoside hydrolase/deacetylase ChbG (UPF0249 family)